MLGEECREVSEKWRWLSIDDCILHTDHKISGNGVTTWWFGDDGVVWYDFISELVANINGYMLIDTGDVIWLSAVGLLLGGNVNWTIK